MSILEAFICKGAPGETNTVSPKFTWNQSYDCNPLNMVLPELINAFGKTALKLVAAVAVGLPLKKINGVCIERVYLWHTHPYFRVSCIDATFNVVRNKIGTGAICSKKNVFTCRVHLSAGNQYGSI